MAVLGVSVPARELTAGVVLSGAGVTRRVVTSDAGGFVIAADADMVMVANGVVCVVDPAVDLSGKGGTLAVVCVPAATVVNSSHLRLREAPAVISPVGVRLTAVVSRAKEVVGAAEVACSAGVVSGAGVVAVVSRCETLLVSALVVSVALLLPRRAVLSPGTVETPPVVVGTSLPVLAAAKRPAQSTAEDVCCTPTSPLTRSPTPLVLLSHNMEQQVIKHCK